METQDPPPRPKVPLELWRELYLTATDYQRLAPWEWMDDTHILGIDNEHGVRLVSVLGNLGEVFGLASYRGTAGADYLLGLLRGQSSPEDPAAHYQIDSLLLDYALLRELRPEDKSLLKRIDYQPAGRSPKRYAQFYSYRPGLVPWFLDAAEVKAELDNLRKAIQFAALVQRRPAAFKRQRHSEYPFSRAPAGQAIVFDELAWHVVHPNEPTYDPPIDPGRLDLADLRGRKRPPGLRWELSAFHTKMAIATPPRPYWPKLGLAVDTVSGQVLSFELGDLETTMVEAAARALVKAIGVCGVRPHELYVDSVNLGQGLCSLAAALRIKLFEATSLRALSEARRSLEHFGQL